MNKNLEEEMLQRKAEGFKYLVEMVIKPNGVPGSEFNVAVYDTTRPTQKEIENLMRKHGAICAFHGHKVTKL